MLSAVGMGWFGIVYRFLFRWCGDGSWVGWTLEAHQQECLNVIQAIRACFRNVFGLMENLRGMNAAKSASLFYFGIDSTSVNWSFPSAGVADFQCPWKLTRFKHDKWHGISDSKRMAAVFPGGTFEMPVGFWRQVERFMRQWAAFLFGVSALALSNSLWIYFFL